MSGAATAPAVQRGSSGAPDAATRILAVGNMYPPQHVGGYELAWQQVMRGALAAGHAVRILTSDHVEHPGVPEQEPDVHRVLRWYWDLENYRFPALNLRERLALERHNASALRHHLREFRPDLVAWWPMGCMSLSLIEQVRRRRVPAVFVVHDDWLVYGWEHDQWLRTWRGPRRGPAGSIVGRLCGIPTRVAIDDAGPFVFNSRYTLERAREEGLRLPSLGVVPPGIDAAAAEPPPTGEWGWRLLYVGRLDRQKGVDVALRALAELPPQATLTIVGSGDARYVAEMVEWAAGANLADRVDFRGFLDGEQLAAAYCHSDVVVFPVRWAEPFGLVPLEAMAAGRPVIATPRGGIAEYARDGENALLVPPDDEAALAAAVCRVADQPALRERLVAAGRRTAASFTVERFVEGTLAAMLSAAAGAQAPDRGRVRRPDRR